MGKSYSRKLDMKQYLGLTESQLLAGNYRFTDAKTDELFTR